MENNKKISLNFDLSVINLVDLLINLASIYDYFDDVSDEEFQTLVDDNNKICKMEVGPNIKIKIN